MRHERVVLNKKSSHTRFNTEDDMDEMWEEMEGFVCACVRSLYQVTRFKQRSGPRTATTIILFPQRENMKTDDRLTKKLPKINMFLHKSSGSLNITCKFHFAISKF